jgi:hypothetical protein
MANLGAGEKCRFAPVGEIDINVQMSGNLSQKREIFLNQLLY